MEPGVILVFGDPKTITGNEHQVMDMGGGIRVYVKRVKLDPGIGTFPMNIVCISLLAINI